MYCVVSLARLGGGYILYVVIVGYMLRVVMMMDSNITLTNGDGELCYRHSNTNQTGDEMKTDTKTLYVVERWSHLRNAWVSPLDFKSYTEKLNAGFTVYIITRSYS